jgi:DNA-binding winged helix-turn-helix (wHTH) protein
MEIEMEKTPRKLLFRFGVFEADQQTGEVRKQGRRLVLQGQPFEILIMLLEHPGELISRNQIRERLWPEGTFVDFDHSLNTAVNKIRDVLGDSASTPRFIETLARRGYRFIAPVQVCDGDSPLIEVPILRKTDVALHPPSPASVASADISNPSNPEFLARLLTASHEVPEVSHRVVRALFLLLQGMYLCFYLISLARLHVIEDIVGGTSLKLMSVVALLITTAVVGIPIRLYLISAVAFKAPGLREKFLRLFPMIFVLDELWALAPFLLLQQIGHGLALGLTAILLYVPFAQRSLILMGAGSPHSARAME